MMVDILFYMTIGMAVGMVSSPIMMKAIKVIKQRRRVSKILKEVSKLQKTGQLDEKHQIL
jgi:preprotein translocase subunit SecF